MVKKNRPQAAKTPAAQDKPATLKDLLNPDVVNRLKAQSDQMRAEEEKQRAEARQKAADAQKAEQKRRENDFEYLLNNSKDFKKYD
ncbi:YqkE family protein [Paenibacillus cremeus]|uniref:DUF3886 domain-containing protein n=1 Tax=Paenibacillus cremeus TaxID=2163881 RepID=A0A559K564_9BACL|nr:YqkE family protein [Paenibacillus cremeus]TVY07274.1 DUF3886 domain-containing protein [Paenibacillus cremeus]